MAALQSIRAAPLSDDHPTAIISLKVAECAAVREGVTYWRRIRGPRRFPSRADVNPRDMTNILRNAVLMRVIDCGADYEYRIVGDAHTVAHGFCMQGKRLS